MRLRFLLLEDSLLDAELAAERLIEGGIDCELRRVETQSDFEAALEQPFDLILADYVLPQFDGISALLIARHHCPETPFIFVSATLGEELAIEALKSGATDYVLKQRLWRLVPSVRRALHEAQERHDRRQAETALRENEQRLRLALAEREQLLKREQAARAVAESARRDAEAANRVKDEFLAVLSHELRTPLNPILGWTRLLRTRKFDAVKTDQALETIERNAKLQTQLIEDLLDVSRILQGKLNLNVSAVNLTETVASAIATVRLAAEAKSIEVQQESSSLSAEFVSGDADRLQQVVWNLVSNAVKFTPAGGKIIVRLSRVDTQAKIEVSDTGQGIAPEFLPHVFEYFRQADSSTTRQFGGLGLGLAIVRHLVELHGGTVYASSLGEGQGATFVIQLPILKSRVIKSEENDDGLRPGFAHRAAVEMGELGVTDRFPSAHVSGVAETAALQPAQQLALSHTASASNPQAVLNNLHVLVVDDEADTRDFLAFLLKQQGAIVTTAASAGAALQAIARSKADVIVSDIAMPEIDGYMLMQQIRGLEPEQGGATPAIALTAYASEFDQQQAIAAGFQRHLAKPVTPEQLMITIAQVLAEVV